MNVDHVDNYDQDYYNWTRTRFMTYLKNDIQLTNDGKRIIPQGGEQFLSAKLISKIPGDISESEGQWDCSTMARCIQHSS